MFSPRSTVLDHNRMDAKEQMQIAVRAGSEMGAVVAARIEAARLIPFRDQEVIEISNADNARFFNVWKVTVRDRNSINSKWV